MQNRSVMNPGTRTASAVFITLLLPIGLLCQSRPGLPLVGPIQATMARQSEIKVSNGQELTRTIQLKDANGTTVVNNVYFRRTNQAGSYVVVTTTTTNVFLAGTPLTGTPTWTTTVTKTVNGTIGPINGNVRQDTMEVTYVQDGGVAQHAGPTTVNVQLDLGSIATQSYQEQADWVKSHYDNAQMQAGAKIIAPPSVGVRLELASASDRRFPQQFALARSFGAFQPWSEMSTLALKPPAVQNINWGCVAFCVAVCGEFIEFPDFFILCLGYCMVEAECVTY